MLRDSLVEVDQGLRLERKPTCTAEEIDGYVWRNNATREEPVKGEDDGLDTLRYAVMYLERPRGVFLA